MEGSNRAQAKPTLSSPPIPRVARVRAWTRMRPECKETNLGTLYIKSRGTRGKNVPREIEIRRNNDMYILVQIKAKKII